MENVPRSLGEHHRLSSNTQSTEEQGGVRKGSRERRTVLIADPISDRQTDRLGTRNRLPSLGGKKGWGCDCASYTRLYECLIVAIRLPLRSISAATDLS